jgi:nucleotide-binding universal stress UspA family protein
MKSILVCVDGSDYSGPCCSCAINIAKNTDAHVDVLYVADLRIFENTGGVFFSEGAAAHPYIGITEQIQSVERAKGEIIGKIVQQIFEKKNYVNRLKFHYLNGFIEDVLREFANNDRGVDLIIMGKRGEHFQNCKGYVGSTTERVLKSAGAPCLILTEKYTAPKEILLAYDGSEHAHEAVRGILRSNGIFGKKVHIVSVRNDGNSKDWKKHMEEVKSLFLENSMDACVVTLAGEVDSAMVKYIKKHSIDALVMGAFGCSGIRHLLMGSTTNKLLNAVDITSLIYRKNA